MRLNPDVIDMYGEESVKPLTAIIGRLGDELAGKVKIDRKLACRYINGVKMPNMLIVDTYNIDKVKSIWDEFYQDWGGEAKEEEMAVTFEEQTTWHIPLCVADEPSTNRVAYALNQRVIDVYGKGATDSLAILIGRLGDLSTQCYVSTDGYVESGNVTMPVEIYTTADIAEVVTRLESVNKVMKIPNVTSVKHLSGEYIQLAEEHEPAPEQDGVKFVKQKSANPFSVAAGAMAGD